MIYYNESKRIIAWCFFLISELVQTSTTKLNVFITQKFKLGTQKFFGKLGIEICLKPLSIICKSY